MLCYFAPMEGMTGPIFRKLHHEMFPGVDRYFTPFLAPTQTHRFTARDLREILPEASDASPTVPQLLTKSSEDFLWAAGELSRRGFSSVNLNVGCPSSTVVAKGKGSGLLGNRAALTSLLEGIFSAASLPVSVKTRIGLKNADDWAAILEIYNRFPIDELIIHPRTRAEYYSGALHEEAFALAAAKSTVPLCFNGELRCAHDLFAIEQRYPTLHAAMLGRGLVANPALVREYRGGAPLAKAELCAFHNALFDAYTACFGAGVAMYRMRELWVCFRTSFADGEHHATRLSHSKDADELLYWADKIFRECSLK